MHLLPTITLIILIALAACHTPIHYPPGGYPYPQHVPETESTFAYYPVKDLMSKRDSFQNIDAGLWLKAFDEPNLSLKPADHAVFRLFHEDGFGSHQLKVLICLTEKEITIKIDSSSHLRFVFDSSRLDSNQLVQMQFISQHYGKDYTKRPMRKRYIDSIIKDNPLLADPASYLRLERKALIIDSHWSYAKHTRPVSPQEFKTFADLLNHSNYWRLPPVYNLYPNEFSEGEYFYLEANTPHQYNFVSVTSSPDNSNFFKACELLIHYARLDNLTHIIWPPQPPSPPKPPLVIQDVQLEDVKQEPRKPKRRK